MRKIDRNERNNLFDNESNRWDVYHKIGNSQTSLITCHSTWNDFDISASQKPTLYEFPQTSLNLCNRLQNGMY
jgi:hypothetical protein